MRLPTAVHIGYPKTGTTTHQKHLFARHSQISYLGKPYADEGLKNEILRLAMEESLTYDSSALKANLQKSDEFEKENGKKLRLISEELFVSASKVRDKGIVAERIREVFAPVKILVTIRGQVEMLQSAYINGGRLLKNVPTRYKGLAMTFEEWLEMVFETPGRSYVGNIRYEHTIEYYRRLFGNESILVLLFEEFVNNKEEYIRSLSGFLGIDAEESLRLLEDRHENPRLLQGQVELELARSRWGAAGKNPLVSAVLKRLYGFRCLSKKSERARVEMSGQWRQRVEEYYREGNRELLKNFSLPMEKYGYPL